MRRKVSGAIVKRLIFKFFLYIVYICVPIVLFALVLGGVSDKFQTVICIISFIAVPLLFLIELIILIRVKMELKLYSLYKGGGNHLYIHDILLKLDDISKIEESVFYNPTLLEREIHYIVLKCHNKCYNILEPLSIKDINPFLTLKAERKYNITKSLLDYGVPQNKIKKSYL